MLTLPAEITIDARLGNRTPTFATVAYAGGIMTPTINGKGAGRVVVDLAGMTVDRQNVPLLYDHDQSSPVGHTESVVNDGKKVTAGGLISQANERAGEILSASRNRFPWTASISVTLDEHYVVPAGKTVTVNGRSLTGPFLLITKSKLREISAVVMGGDPEASLNLAARAARGITMELNQTTEPQTATAEDPSRVSERARTTAILTAAARNGVSDPLRIQQFIDSEDTAEQIELGMLRAARPQGRTVNTFAPDRAIDNGSVLTAALMVRGGLGVAAEQAYGDQVMPASRAYENMTLVDICRRELNRSGHPDATAPAVKIVRAALSTHNLQDVFSNVANKFLLEGYRETPATWRSFAAIRSTTDFKSNTGVRPSIKGNLEQVPRGGEIKHASLDESTFNWKVDTFAKTLSLDRRDVINDDLGSFQDAARAFGRMAQRGVNDLVYSRLLNATTAYFNDTTNSNLGSQALGITGLSAAYTAMMSQRDSEGNDLDLRPAVLLVPPALKDLALQLVSTESLAYVVGASGVPAGITSLPTANPNRNLLRVEVEPRLSNTVKYPGKADANAWYLMGSPADMPVVVGFLNGVQTPTVEYFGMDSDPNVLAVQWRVHFDYGCALGDYRAARKEDPGA